MKNLLKTNFLKQTYSNLSILAKNSKLSSLNNFPSSIYKTNSFKIHNSRDEVEKTKTKNPDNYWVTEKDRDNSVITKSGSFQFSKKPIMDNYGELPHGEIPEPLKYVRDFKMTTLSNGIRVCTEAFGGQTAAVGVFVDAGSRYETVDTCGTSHFLEHLLFKGTKSRSRSRFETEIENLGATLDAYTSREHTLFHMTCFKDNVKNCVDILSDMIQNPLLSNESIQEEKDTILAELENSNKDPQETIMEAVHFNCYRDHMIGAPILGDVDNINNVNKNMVEEYYHTNYHGSNLIIIGTGAVDHEQFVTQVSEKFGNMK